MAPGRAACASRSGWCTRRCARIMACVRELDEVEDAAAQEGVRQLLLVVRRDEHDGPLHCADVSCVSGMEKRIASSSRSRSLGNSRSALSISSMRRTTRSAAANASPERAELDVAADVGHVAVAEAAVVEALHGVVDVEAVLRLGGRLDVPGDERHPRPSATLLGEQRLAGAGLALDEQRPAELHGDVHRLHQLGGGDVVAGAAIAGGGRLAVSGGLARRRTTCCWAAPWRASFVAVVSKERAAGGRPRESTRAAAAHRPAGGSCRCCPREGQRGQWQALRCP